MDDANDILAVMRASGALKEGHFLLSSGRHSDRYVEKFDLLRQPEATSQVCTLIADRFRDRGVDVVAGPTTGGVILAFEVARQLGVAAAYAERASGSVTAREFRRGTRFAQGARILVVDDILTTGGSVRETLRALNRQPVEVVGIAVLVDRSSEGIDLGVPLHSLATMDIATWEPETCPLCARGIPLTRPGTTPGAAKP
ncbi:MAG: orotate phosphoribosyltransferase [Thermomicrobiales bacterium]|nr:orotate phosphoribosyltransferase [Thermomicrobiales bacterium]